MANKNIYIMNFEAADIFNHMHRNGYLNKKYSGMIPNSLELNKLKSIGLKTIHIKYSDKFISNDIINIKFNQKIKSGEDIIKILNKKIEKNKGNIHNHYKNIGRIKLDIIQNPQSWRELSNEKLREYFYTSGIFIKHIDCITNKVISVDRYVPFQRSPAKSRTGQCLFIKENLLKDINSWCRMGLEFKKDVDYPSLLSYESLVGSAAEDFIKIDPKCILIVDDLDSKFNMKCSVVRQSQNGLLDSFEENVEVSNSLFDGESLLQYNVFHKNKSMMLLRNHMFKSAAFATDIQGWLKDYHKKNIKGKYKEWKIKNIFNEEMYARDILLICTPSSLKALKFNNSVEMWNHWKLKVYEDNCIFSVVKYEKESKRGYDDNGEILQQMSYQMINSLPASYEDIEELCTYEKKYINELKNNDSTFIDYLNKEINEINSNEMLVNLYNINNSIINTKLFRDFRSKQISDYISYIKRGKIRLAGDYAIILGNPIEFLYHAVGVNVLDDKYQLHLKNNQVYTTLFDFDKKYTCFRNPHTSPSNVLLVENKYVEDIEKYFKLTKNIVCVNAINFPIQRILSGMDYDSDSMVIFNNKKLNLLAEKCFGKFNICINGVKKQKKSYEIDNKNWAEIDNKLSSSQFNIGIVVNSGQIAMSKYWDDIKRSPELLKKVDIATVLSEICIDMAKKFFEINLKKEIKNLNLQGDKPLFFEKVSQNNNISNKISKHNCPMDFLQEIMSFSSAEYRDNIDICNLLVQKDITKRDRKQSIKILGYINEMTNEINHIYTTHKGLDKEITEERNILIDDKIKYYCNTIKKYKIKPYTMYALILETLKNRPRITLNLFNVLFKTHKDTFLNAWKHTTETILT